jgi:hypothetical protein
MGTLMQPKGWEGGDMGSGVDGFDPTQAIRTIILADSRVESVELVGSRASGTATVLSDWDYRIRSVDPDEIVRQLPSLVTQLNPLAQLWDPLTGSAVYMVILDGAVKVDLLLDTPIGWASKSASRLPPPTLREVDAHFWDWNLWLGSKRLRGQNELVSAELTKMWRHLLRPIGATRTPATQEEAVSMYLGLRHIREQQLGEPVPRELGNAVVSRLRAAGLLRTPLARC